MDVELETRVSELEKRLSSFSRELRFALGYIQLDAASSLTKSRLVLEKLLVSVYCAEMEHEPRKPLLGDILADNQFTKKIERRILSRMNAIRDMGNLGPHGEFVEPSDAARVLDDLCEVLDWYLRRYHKHEAPATEETTPGAGDIVQDSAPYQPPASSPTPKVVDGILTLSRKAQYQGAAFKVNISVNGESKGSLWIGGSMRLQLPAGTHDIEARCWGASPAQLGIAVLPGQNHHVSVSWNWTATKILLERVSEK